MERGPLDGAPAASPELQSILDGLSAREPIFHRAEFGTTRADFEKMTAEDFWETGASGRIYSREFVLDLLDMVGNGLGRWKTMPTRRRISTGFASS